ncbi:MAG: DNA-3-methyladenine glycosylase 2 family protein [Acidobacteria bacterium]|nr:DNA-3-methyladenine glycosylase 2 family protein [Acidobacteriota bacterium]
MMTPDDYTRARRILLRRDPVLASIIRGRGACGLADLPPRDPFTALVRAITYQQLSTSAATTIFNRLLARVANGSSLAPEHLVALSDTDLRSAGYSRQKIGYMRDLSERASAGTIRLHALHDMTDEDVITELTQIKGIGRWSAEMILIFTLKRPDVFPIADFGILKAIRLAYRLRKPPSVVRLQRIAEPWRPYRSVACWYLWRSLDNGTPGK